MTRLIFALTLGLFVGNVAWAQDEEEDTSGREVKYKERTEIDFEGVDVSGELVRMRPEHGGELVHGVCDGHGVLLGAENMEHARAVPVHCADHRHRDAVLGVAVELGGIGVHGR